MKFLIRDDDPSAMTRPEELENCWGEIWDDIPIGLSVTPFRIPGDGKGVPEAYLGSDEALPLEANPELVTCVRDWIARGRVHVAMHGYNHTRPMGQPEYVAGEQLEEKTLHGRRYLEALLGCEINTFVPPNNGMGMEGFKAVAAAKMNVVNNQPYGRILGFPRTGTDLLDLCVAAQYSLRRRIGSFSSYEVQSYSKFRQLPYQTVGPSTELEALEKSFSECGARKGIFVLATHYHAFERSLEGGEMVGEIVRRLVDRVRGSGEVKFQTYDQVWASSGG